MQPHTIAARAAQVFHVGRRRFLTERAAFAHLARLRIGERRPCDCETADYDDFGRITYLGFTCARHRAELVARYARLLRRAWRRGWRPATELEPGRARRLGAAENPE